MIDPDRVDLRAHGLVGDTATAAAVSADGTIDWYCPGRLDQPAALYRLLDPVAGGAVRIGPARLGPAARRRPPAADIRYDPGTNVVRTRLSGPDGEIEVVDAMPWPGGTQRPPGRIVRVATARRGPVEVEIEVAPGHRFAVAGDVDTWSGGVAFGSLAVRADATFEARPVDRDRAVWRAGVVLAPGQQLVVTVDDRADDHHRPLSPDAAERLVDATGAAWRRHLYPLTYDGPYRSAVERSVLACKLLQSYATGAVAAAATTSLPEVEGGERNEDRRAAWIRDAAVAVQTFARVGLPDDGLAAAEWLRVALADGDVPLAPVYDLEGGPAQPEEELALPGRLRSQPVRTGSRWGGDDPPPGRQLDLYGDLVAALSPRDGPLTSAWPALVRHADWLADHWAAPDQGRWEIRGRPRPFVASRVQVWSALDRMARLARARNPLDLDAAGWALGAAEVLRWLERDGLAPDGGLRLDDTPADLPDAALLRVAWQGPWPVDLAPMVARTVDRVLLQLSSGPFVHRYPPELDDGQAGTPGADVTASFWAVRALALLGRWEEAHDRMASLCGLAQPLGLLGESVSPASGRLLGNLPSASAHLALIDAAVALTAGPR